MKRNSSTGLIGLIGAVLALVVGLHQTGNAPGLTVDWGQPVEWLQTSHPELVVGAILRQIGLILGYWVLASTAAYAVARIRNRSMRGARFLTLPLARRLVDRAVATSVAVSLLGSPLLPAAAAEPPVVFEAAGDGIPVPHVRVIEQPPVEPAAPPAVADFAPIPGPPQRLAQPTPQHVARSASDVTHVVAEGDNLWTIAAAHLESRLGPGADRDRITEYWLTVIAHNRATLRSGDPNLIYPGELIALPRIGAMS